MICFFTFFEFWQLISCITPKPTLFFLKEPKEYFIKIAMWTRGHKNIFILQLLLLFSCCSVVQSCPTFCDPMDCSMSVFPVHHHFLELTQMHDHRVGNAIQPSHPQSILLFLPSVFPSIRIFSKELALCIKWQKYWSFSINPYIE